MKSTISVIGIILNIIIPFNLHISFVAADRTISPCISISSGYAWNQGQNGNLEISFPVAGSSWEVILKFDRAVDSLAVYNGKVTKIDSTTFLVENKNYNGVQAAGGSLNSGWQSKFSDTNSPPQIVSAELKNVSCGPPGATTSTTTTTTTTVTTATATSTAPSTTSEATSTESGSAITSCISIKGEHSWNSGQNGKLEITFPETVTSWEIILKFDEPINVLRVYQGQVTKIDSTTFLVKNKDYNGVQAAGGSLISGWQSQFPNSSSPPQMVSAEFKNINCGSSGITTTTVNTSSSVSTLPPTTTASTATPTTTVTTTTPTTTASPTTTVTTAAPTTTFTTTSPSTDTTTVPGNSQSTKYDYNEVLKLSNFFYQAQRSGPLDAFGDFNHDKIGYRGDSALQDGSDNGVDLTGGYYDGK